MQVQVNYYGGLYEYIPKHIKNQTLVNVPQGFTVCQLIEKLAIPEHAIWLVTIENQQVTQDTVLNDGDHIEIFAPATGG